MRGRAYGHAGQANRGDREALGNPCVIIAQPVHQHAYETAVATQQANLLQRFYTGIYDTGRGPTSPRLLRRLPRSLGAWVERNLRRRRHPELDPTLVATIPVYHVISRAAAFAAARVGVSAAGMETWAHESFDAAVGRRIAHAAPRIVYAYEGSALATLSHARSWGATTVLDVPNAHEYVCSELRAAGSSVGPTAAMTARVREERALADYFLAPSDFVIECLVDHGVPQQKILRVPYGADVERFRPATHQEKGVFRAIFVGTVGDRKGVRYLLEAWRSLALPGAELVLVGAADRSAPTMLREHAGHYRWVGQVPSYEVQRIFSTADVFVFPSLAEGSARVTYEAMALGLPVITTPNSGAVTRPGIDGLLVPPRNVEALREAIATLYSEPELRVNMGRNGRRLIEAGYTWHDYRRRVGKILSAISRHEDPHAALDAAW